MFHRVAPMAIVGVASGLYTTILVRVIASGRFRVAPRKGWTHFPETVKKASGKDVLMGNAETRFERDTMGEVRVPKSAYYGAQTQRAIDNFPISGLKFPPIFIHALGLIKQAAAAVNHELGLLTPELARAIGQAGMAL